MCAQFCFHHDCMQIILGRNETSEELAGKYVDLYDYSKWALRGALEGCLSS